MFVCWSGVWWFVGLVLSGFCVSGCRFALITAVFMLGVAWSPIACV